MPCRDCHAVAADDPSGRCWPCFVRAIDALTARITRATPEELDAVYFHGMLDLDADPGPIPDLAPS